MFREHVCCLIIRSRRHFSNICHRIVWWFNSIFKSFFLSFEDPWTTYIKSYTHFYYLIDFSWRNNNDKLRQVPTIMVFIIYWVMYNFIFGKWITHKFFAIDLNHFHKKNKDFYLIKSRLKELTRVQISQVNLHKKKQKECESCGDSYQ